MMFSSRKDFKYKYIKKKPLSPPPKPRKYSITQNYITFKLSVPYV